MTVSDLISKLADLATEEGITGLEPGAADPGEELSAFLRGQGCRPSQEFYAVLLLAGELTDRRARAEGYDSQAHRAASIAFSR